MLIVDPIDFLAGTQFLIMHKAFFYSAAILIAPEHTSLLMIRWRNV